METSEIEAALDRAQFSAGRGEALKGTGFTGVVALARSDINVARQFEARLSAIDRMTFESRVKLRIPVWAGNTVLAAGTVAASFGLGLAARLGNVLLRTAVFFAAMVVLLITTHSLAHWAVGRLVGMRFIYYFLGGPPPPRPGIKSDLGSYLTTPPGLRVLMHASGAVVTKVLPFALIPAALSDDLPAPAIAVLIAVGVLQIITDVLFSTKTSDWMKVKRELKAGRAS